MSKPNDIALAIDKTEGRSDTDAAAKTLLVFKEIQATLVEMTIDEFMHYSHETIVKQTEFGYFNNRHQSSSNDDRIFGLDSVQKELDSGSIALDLIYPILYPDKEGGVLVNVEVQRANVSSDGFARKLIYVSSVIRNQKGTTYTGTNYSDLWKVYGLWIHTNPPKDRQNTINYVYLEQDSRSTFFYEREEIDRFGIISIFLGRSRKNETRLHRFLKYTVDPSFTTAKRKKILEEDFGIEMTKEMEKVAELMHEDYAYYFEEEAEKYQFALDSKDQELTEVRQKLIAKDQELSAKDQELSAKKQELIAKDQQFQDELRSIEEMLFNIVLKNARTLNISFQDALASSGCSLKMQRKLLQMAQDQGIFAV